MSEAEIAAGKGNAHPSAPIQKPPHALVRDHAPDRPKFPTLKAEAKMGLLESAPHLSAHYLVSREQGLAAACVIAALIGFGLAFPLACIIAVNLVASVYFLIAILFRFWLAILGLSAPARLPAQSMPVSDEALPVVTVLLPVHDEAAGLPILADAMARLDYPLEKLDFKLLLEAADTATIAEARRLKLDEQFECLLVPNTEPKTKPKACNFGLARARGDLTVIYDAEDAPEPDQLRKAAAEFAGADEMLACLQARLNFYNAEENLLTRLFSLEYALWFDLMLPALEKLRLPIPLGGTSNIFRTDILRKVGGWDPYNVTEDADLGLRLARFGYRTAILDSTTYEEANCRLENWIRQRSRWMKGYMQTWLVHMREPRGFAQTAGWRGHLTLQLFVAGNVFSALINPALWFLAALWAVVGRGAVYPEMLFAVNLAALVAGNLLFIALAAVAPTRRGWIGLVPYAALAPVYWQFASIGAWRGLFQLFSRPFHWEKTAHVISSEALKRRAAALAGAGHIARPRGAS